MSDDWHEQKTYDSLILLGSNAVKFVLLANGGALVAVMGILSKREDIIENVFWPLVIYCIGVTFGGLANITGYYTQLRLFEEHKGKPDSILENHETWLYASMIAVILGMVCFVVGSIYFACILTKTRFEFGL